MTGKRATKGRGRAPDAGRQPAEKKRSGVVLTGRGERLRDAREQMGFGRKYVADTLGWSESRLISYEMEATQPNASEIEELAKMYGRDRAWLAWGEDYERLSIRRAASTLWLPCLNGGDVAVPLRVVAGIAGRLECALVDEATSLGLSPGDVLVVRVDEAPTIGALWALRSAVDGVCSGWIVTTSRSSAQVKLDHDAGAVAVAARNLLGRVVATLRRAPQNDQKPARTTAKPRR